MEKDSKKEGAHICPHCGSKNYLINDYLINDYFNHIEFFHLDKPLI